KYFVLGAFCSALFLYGIALVYGSTSTTNLAGIAAYLANNVITSNGVLLAGMVLLLVGLGFKVAAVPFHTWTPDVYQGSPSPVTGFMAAAAQAAGVAVAGHRLHGRRGQGCWVRRPAARVLLDVRGHEARLAADHRGARRPHAA